MADMGLTEITAVSQTTIAEFVQAELKQRSVLLPTVQNFASVKGDKQIDIGRAGGFSSEDKAENSSLTAQVLTFVADSLALDKHKAILVRLEDIAGLQSKPEVEREIAERMIRELALNIDEDIYAQAELTSAAAPDHRVAYDNAATLGSADILVARQLLHEQNVPFNECVIVVSPKSETDLLAISDFVHVDRYGADAQGLRNGELGKLYGAPVIMTNVAADLKTLIYHPSHVALSIQKSTSFETQRDLPNVATEYLMNQIYGSKVLDAGVRGVMLGTAA